MILIFIYTAILFSFIYQAQIREAKVRKIKKEKAKSGQEFNREEVEAAIDAEDAKDTKMKKIINPKIIRLKVSLFIISCELPNLIEFDSANR